MEADGREEREEEDHGVAWYVVDRDNNGLGRAIIRAVSKDVVGRNLYPYTYPRVEIRTHTRWVSDGYRVPVRFVISHVKTTSK
jgi:hypothetical protein